MATFNTKSVSPQSIIMTGQARLKALRQAFSDCEDFYAWLVAQDDADLKADLLFDESDLAKLRAAYDDAHDEYVLRMGGPVGEFTLPRPFAASQTVVIGPA